MKIAGIAGDQLASFVSRVERLISERSGLNADIREVYAEAKGNGFDVKTIKKIVKLRQLDPMRREEEETLLDLYKRVLGMSAEREEEEAPEEAPSTTTGRL